MRYRTKTIKIKKEKLFGIAVLSLVLIIFLYFTVLMATVFNTVKTARAEQEIKYLNHDISALEFELISIKNGLNMELAYSLGFKEAEDIKFIQKKSVATILTGGSI